jgi:hypothetical protein
MHVTVTLKILPALSVQGEHVLYLPFFCEAPFGRNTVGRADGRLVVICMDIYMSSGSCITLWNDDVSSIYVITTEVYRQFPCGLLQDKIVWSGNSLGQ